jgi:hypothetical protein
MHKDATGASLCQPVLRMASPRARLAAPCQPNGHAISSRPAPSAVTPHRDATSASLWHCEWMGCEAATQLSMQALERGLPRHVTPSWKPHPSASPFEDMSCLIANNLLLPPGSPYRAAPSESQVVLSVSQRNTPGCPRNRWSVLLRRAHRTHAGHWHQSASGVFERVKRFGVNKYATPTVARR